MNINDLNSYVSPESKTPMTQEQCTAQGMPYPSYLVTTKDGRRGMVSQDAKRATVRLATAGNNNAAKVLFDTLEPISIINNIRSNSSEHCDVRRFSNERFSGVAHIDNDREGYCVFQISFI